MRTAAVNAAVSAVAAMVALFVVAGCSTGQRVDLGERGSGNLVAAIAGEPDQLDPHKTSAYFSFEVLENVFDTLVAPDADLKMRPALAQYWDVSPDQLFWTFHLRRGVTFHDGTPFTADDVVYSYRRIIDEKLANADKFSAVTDVSASDNSTVVIRSKAAKALRRRISLVLQDPFSSLNPRTRVGTAIGEPLAVHRIVDDKGARAARVGDLLDLVGLCASFAERYPHAPSGGQRQRVSIARALAAETDLLILGESTAVLDVSVQARVLELLADLQRELGLTYLFIAHDLAVVERVSHDVLVMRRGRPVEYRPAAELFEAPAQEYTRALLAAVPPERPRASAVASRQVPD